VVNDAVHHGIVGQKSDEQWPDHVFSQPLGLVSGLGSDLVMNIKSRVPPGEDAVCPFGAEKLVADKIGQNLAGKMLCQPRVNYPGDLMESARLVLPALNQQEMQVRVEIRIFRPRSTGLHKSDAALGVNNSPKRSRQR
jgi:hypothetical protein